jgi:hypothetical protein
MCSLSALSFNSLQGPLLYSLSAIMRNHGGATSSQLILSNHKTQKSYILQLKFHRFN